MNILFRLPLLAVLLAAAPDRPMHREGPPRWGPPPMQRGMRYEVDEKLPDDIKVLIKQLRDKEEAFRKETEPLRKEIREKMMEYHKSQEKKN